MCIYSLWILGLKGWRTESLKDHECRVRNVGIGQSCTHPGKAEQKTHRQEATAFHTSTLSFSNWDTQSCVGLVSVLLGCWGHGIDCLHFLFGKYKSSPLVNMV